MDTCPNVPDSHFHRFLPHPVGHRGKKEEEDLCSLGKSSSRMCECVHEGANVFWRGTFRASIP